MSRDFQMKTLNTLMSVGERRPKTALPTRSGTSNFSTASPYQVPFEILEELATFVGIELDIPREELNVYAPATDHLWTPEQLRLYLKLVRFTKHAETALMEHLFHQSLQIQPTDSLLLKATDFLRERQVLNPADDTLTILPFQPT